MADKAGVVKAVSVARGSPPVACVYQFIIPLFGLAFNTNDPAPERLAAMVLIMDGTAFMVAGMAILSDVQPLSVASA